MKVTRGLLAMLISSGVQAHLRGHLRNSLQEQFTTLEEGLLRNLVARDLQTPHVPRRKCGEVITIVRQEESILLAETLLEAIPIPGLRSDFSEPLRAAFQRTYNYDVEVRVICSTCLDVGRTFGRSQELHLSRTGRFGFQEYCGRGKHGSDVIHSALLLSPVYPGTNIVVQGRLNGGVFMHGTLTDETACPTEFYPTNLTRFVQDFDRGPVALINDIFNEVSCTLAAASGAITISPDFLGFGQGTFSQGGARKSFVVKNLYAQAAVVSWLKAKSYYNKVACTELSNTVTVGGYSEGGYAAFAAGEALADLGAEVLEIRTGGAPIRLGRQFQWVLEQFDSNRAGRLLDVVIPFAGNAYSSTNPDLPNSNRGTDMIDPRFRNLIVSWFENSVTFGEVQELARAISSPSKFTPSLLRADGIELFRNATRQNIKEPCDLVSPDTDMAILCRALVENDLVGDFERTTIPTTICHSANDDVVTIENMPNLAANPDYLSRFSLLGIKVNVNHILSGIPCIMNMLAPFTRIHQEGPREAHRIEAMECKSTGSDGTNLGIIIGAIVGGLAVLSLLGWMIWRSRREKDHEEEISLPPGDSRTLENRAHAAENKQFKPKPEAARERDEVAQGSICNPTHLRRENEINPYESWPVTQRTIRHQASDGLKEPGFKNHIYIPNF